MTLPRRQQRLLEEIDRQVSDADQRLAWLFGVFGRFWADEPLPAREQLNTRASRSWSSLVEALAAGVWPVPPLADPPGADVAGGSARGGQADRRPNV